MAQALVKFLDRQYISLDGVEYKFVEGMVGIFGHGSVLGLGEALQSGGLRYYRSNNEQGAGHMAIGFSKQHNRKKILCAFSSIGPGAMNMLTAAATATANRIPVLFLPGDIFASRQPDPVLQQIEQEYDYSISSNDAFRPLSKYWDRIVRPEQLMTAAINAMRVLCDPAATGAVTLSLPQDTVAEVYDYPLDFLEKRVHVIQRRPLFPGAAKEICALIARHKKPLILCGGGVRYSEAWEELLLFAEKHRIPVAETQSGKGLLPWDHPLNLGGLGTTGTLAANRVASEADCLIAVGTRLNDFHTASKWAFRNPELRVIGINVNGMDATKLNAEPYYADAKLALRELNAEQDAWTVSHDTENAIQDIQSRWRKEADRLYSLKSETSGMFTQTRALGILNEKSDKNAIIVSASGSLPSDLERLWRTRARLGYHLEYAYSCMGYEIAGAIGARLADPDRPVWAVLGDGAYLMYHQELVMAVEEGLHINIFLVDNHGWQCIDNLQTGQGIPRFGCELRMRNPSGGQLDGGYVPIDFVKNAQSYGCDAQKADTEEELEQAIINAEKSNSCSLVLVECVPKSMSDGYETWWRAGTPEKSIHASVEQAARVMKEHIDEARKF